MSDAALRNLRMLSRYTAWANTRLFDALAALPAGAATARRNHGQHSMVGTLAHAWVVDRIWQAHLQGRAHGYSSRQPEVEPPLAQLQQDQAQLDQWYIAYADGLDATRHEEVVAFRFVDGGEGAMRRGDMLLHVVNPGPSVSLRPCAARLCGMRRKAQNPRQAWTACLVLQRRGSPAKPRPEGFEPKRALCPPNRLPVPQAQAARCWRSNHPVLDSNAHGRSETEGPQTYHRGYVADMLYQAGSRPPVMDLPVFLRDVPQAQDFDNRE